MFFLGYDIGGTKTELAILYFSEGKKEFQIVHRERMPTQRLNGYTFMLKAITQFTFDVLKEAKLSPSKISGIGIGLPGTVHPKKQSMIFGNTMAFINKPFSADLKKSLKVKCPVVSENDANCFAYA